MHAVTDMKSATIPSLRVTPALRQAAEDVLHEGESLSAFVELAVRQQVAQRQSQEAFIARGLASREQAKASGRYVTAAAVTKRLEGKLAKARRKP